LSPCGFFQKLAAKSACRITTRRARGVVMLNQSMLPPKAVADDTLGRFREDISDPLNLLIERVPLAGIVHDNEVYLHNGNRVPVSGSGAHCGPFAEFTSLCR